MTPGELSLTFRIHINNVALERQVVALERRGEAWRATGTSREISHVRQ